MKSLSEQVGGNHYTKFKIQPIEYSMSNGLDACQHSVVKYITRFRDKGGISDLKKAKHMIDLLIDLEYGGECASKQARSIDGAVVWDGSNPYGPDIDKNQAVKVWERRGGKYMMGKVKDFAWTHAGLGSDIVAYKVVE